MAVKGEPMSVEPEEAPEVEVVPYSEPELPVLVTTELPRQEESGPTLITFPLSGLDWAFNPPTPDVQLHIQESLRLKGLYSGKLNGMWGDQSVFAIQQAVGHLYGSLDRELCLCIQEFAFEVGRSTVGQNEEAVLSQQTWEIFAKGLEVDEKKH